MDLFKQWVWEAHHLNQKDAVPKDKQESIESLLNELLADEKNFFPLLDIVSVYNYYHSKKMLKAICLKYMEKIPDLKAYLQPVKNDEITLTPEGVKIMIEFYVKSYKFPKDSIKCIEKEELADAIKAFQKGDQPFLGLVLYQKGDNHLTPIYLERNGDDVDVLITDSKGAGSGKVYSDLIVKEFAGNRNLNIHLYGPLRQTDDSSCPVFSLLDLKNLIEGALNGRKFSQVILGPVQILSEPDQFPVVKKFSLLPPDMMKVTQSIKSLDHYRKYSSPDFLADNYSPKFNRRSPKGDPEEVHQTLDHLSQKVSSCTFYSPDKYKLNKYVERKRLLYTLHIIATLLRFDVRSASPLYY